MKVSEAQTIVIFTVVSQHLLFHDAISRESDRETEVVESVEDSKEINENQLGHLTPSLIKMPSVVEPLYFNDNRVLHLNELRKRVVWGRKVLDVVGYNVVRIVVQNVQDKVVINCDLLLPLVGGRVYYKKVKLERADLSSHKGEVYRVCCVKDWFEH